jgi:hypothetical protein
MSKEKKITPTGFWECKNPDIYKFDWQLASMLTSIFKSRENPFIIDLGCGNGAYTRYFQEKGIKAQCCDGNPHTPQISSGTCGICDLSKPLNPDPTYDWVMCLEVAEHVPVEFESVIVENIKKLSDHGIILSWAIPGQGGHGHVNERPNEYVRGLFSEYKENFALEEQLRNVATLPWFKNTIFVFEK